MQIFIIAALLFGGLLSDGFTKNLSSRRKLADEQWEYTEGLWCHNKIQTINIPYF